MQTYGKGVAKNLNASGCPTSLGILVDSFVEPNLFLALSSSS